MKRKQNLILFISALICLIAASWAFFSIQNLPRYDYSISDWQSNYAIYNGTGFSVNDKLKNSREDVVFLHGPNLPLKKGSYTANISYSASEDQKCIAAAGVDTPGKLVFSEGLLSKYLHTIDYQFETTDDIPEFQLLIRYSGVGDFTVNSISISSNSNQSKRIAVEIIAAVLLINFLILLFKQDTAKRNTIFALAGITILVSFPLIHHGLSVGHDLSFHFMRIEAIIQAIRSGQFPARISSSSLYGLGYPLSIYYNDLFLYFPAVLRIFGFSVDQAYKLYVLVINLFTTLAAFASFSRIFKNRNTSLILVLLYSASSYRLVNIFVRSAVGEYTAQVFLPIIALVLYRIYFDDDKESQNVLKNTLLLTFAMSGFIGSHVLTTLIVSFFLLFFCILFWRKTLRKKTILTYLCAVFLTILINLYFLVPFLDYYINTPTKIKTVVEDIIKPIQKYGAYPAQYFAFFQPVYGWLSTINGRMQITPGLSLIVILLTGLYKRALSNKGKHFDFLLYFSLLTLWLGTNIFPWDWLMVHFKQWKVLTSIQFPFRFLGLACLFITLLAGCVFDTYKVPYLRLVTVISTVFMGIWFVGSLSKSSDYVYVYDTSGVRFNDIGGGEFVLAGSPTVDVNTEVWETNMAEVRIISRNSFTLRLYCRTDGTGREHTIELPVYNYKGYHIYDDNGKEYDVYNGKENHIGCSLPDVFDGNLTVVFEDPVSWRVALYVSAAAALVSCLAAFKKRLFYLHSIYD